MGTDETNRDAVRSISAQMRIQDNLNRIFRDAARAALVGILVFIVGLVTALFWIRAIGVLILISSLAYLCFGALKCPACSANLGCLVHLTSWGLNEVLCFCFARGRLPKQYRYCPCCGIDLMTELDVKSRHPKQTPEKDNGFTQ